MNEKEYSAFLRQKSSEFRKASLDIIPGCLQNNGCRGCPFHDKNMENDFNTHCFRILLSCYAIRLEQMADDIDGKDYSNYATQN